MIDLSVCYKANRLSQSLPPDLTISPKPMHKRTKLVALIVLAVVLSSLSGIYYYIMHNTIIVSVSLADDKIITSDGRGPYKHQVDGVWLDYEFLFLMDLNISSRLVHVSFMDAHWKDSNLRDVPSRLQSKNYYMDLVLQEKDQTGRFVDVFKMDVGEKESLPKLQIQIVFFDPDTGALAGIYTIHEKGGFLTQFLLNNILINSTTPEPPQSLRNDSFIELTRTSEDTWVLDVDAWFVSYYGPRYIYAGHFLKDYVKLNLNLTLNKKRAI